MWDESQFGTSQRQILRRKAFEKPDIFSPVKLWIVAVRADARNILRMLPLFCIRLKFEIVLDRTVVADDYRLTVRGDSLMKKIAALLKCPAAYCANQHPYSP